MFTTPSRLVLFSLFSTNGALAALPLIDFDRMGTVGLAGAFAGLDLFQNSTASPAFDPTTSTLFSRDADGALARLASTSSGGSISAGCTLASTYYVAGSFSSIGTTSANNVASYSSSTGSFSALGSNGPNGDVDAIFCDTTGNKVWVGGSFTSPGSNVAVWDPKAGTWSEPPFVGVSGAQSRVLSITTNASDSSIFFAGSFITAFPGDGTVVNGTNNPNVPYSAGATPYSSSLVPVPLQNAQVVGSPSTTDSGFTDIQNILCPSAADGANNSWFAADGSTALITIRDFSFISANGIRLGNTFQSNHGTTAFTVTTIPDNNVQTLNYVDPATGQSQTCSGSCPLSTDSSLLYQDFLFNSTLSITGVQIQLTEFTGASAGLHILQILSSGAFASAVESNNGVSCFAPNPSNVSFTGDWEAKVANTNISGTTQTVLVSDVDVGTSASSGPTFTWIPYVSASGNYDINLLVPGCTNFQDCDARTTVTVTVFPGENIQPSVTTVSQQNTEDATILLYSGPVVPSSPNFVATITMALAASPVGSGQNGQYEIVADRVQLVLKSVGNSTSTSGTSSSSSSTGTIDAFGFLEWPRSFTTTSANATQTLPNSTLTSLDSVGINFYQGVGGSNGLSFSNPAAITAVVHHPSGTIFLGGNFTLSSGSATGSANLVAFTNGALTSLADNGLNGPVTSLVLNGDQLYVGGDFSDTLSGSTSGKLKGVALYNVQSGSWSPLGAGVDGPVSSLGLANGQVLVAGNFTQVLSSSASSGGNSAAGFATWNVTQGTWVNSGGFVVGSMTFVGNETSSSQIIAGNVVASHQVGANGMVLLSNGDSKTGPAITPLGAQLDMLPSSATATSLRRRSPISSSAWMSHIRKRLFSRQSSTTQLPSLPSPLPAPAPAVLAGVFWTNSSSSTQVAILGGNFSFVATGSSSASESVAIYNPASGTIQGLQGSQVNGTVRSLAVVGNLLYIGGEFTIPNTNANGLAVYDLGNQTWSFSAVPPLSGSSSAPVVVRSVSTSASQENIIIVAGTFTQAGSLNCQSICAYNTANEQWNILGNGIQGEVASVAYAGDNQELLMASGSIALSDNSVSNVAQYSFSNASWIAVGNTGELPGPVSAIEVNNGNSSSVFVAGHSTDGTSFFLSFWNGNTWSTIDSTIQVNSTVAQLTMVPLQDTHSANGVIESDRMLMVSGSLSDATFGNASSILFDGQNFIPYISTSSANGSLGAVASLFRSFSTFSFSQRHFLATGVVILISIAIAAGVVFLLALIGILWTLLSRREEKMAKFDAAEEDDDGSTHHRPSSLLEHINAATRSTILGASPFSGRADNDGAEEEEKVTHENHDPFGPDASNFIRAETPLDAIGGMLAEETSRPARARYSFDGAGEGELPISAGAQLEVLDDRDPAWWYARDVHTGQEGVVPAAYLY